MAYLLGVWCLGVGLTLPLGARTTYAADPAANAQDCVFAFKEEKNADPTSSYDAPSDYQVCMVIIKAGSEQSGGGELTFVSDGCQAFVPGNNYCVTGIGTGSATATRTCEESRDCHAISHASYWIEPIPPTNTPTSTATNTPTNTPTDTPTDTPTNTPTNTPTSKPTKTPTNTPTDTPTSKPTKTPTNTPTDTPTSTPTNTPTDTPTATPTNTAPVPPPWPGPSLTPTEPAPTDPPTATPTDVPPGPGPSDTPTDPPTATPPAPSPASTQGPPPAPTSAVAVLGPVPVTGDVQSPVLIPVTGIDMAAQGLAASGLFQNLGLAFLGLGLGLHGLSLRRPGEE